MYIIDKWLKWYSTEWRPEKKYVVEYLIQCGWGVMGAEYTCYAINKRHAHEKWLQEEIFGLYGDRNKLSQFKYMKDDIKLCI